MKTRVHEIFHDRVVFMLINLQFIGQTAGSCFGISPAICTRLKFKPENQIGIKLPDHLVVDEFQKQVVPLVT